MIEIYMMYGFFFVAILGILLFAVSKPYGIVGLKIWITKLKYKQNAGVLLMMNKAGDISRIIGINLSESKYSEKIGKNKEPRNYVYSKDQLQQGRFMGLPYIIYIDNDTKTNVGIYFQQSDEFGNPLVINTDKGTIPYLTPLKPSVSLPPSFFEALVGDHALTMALKEFMDKNSKLMIIAGATAIAAAAAAWFGYDLINNHMPSIMVVLQDSNAKLTEILEILRSI